MATTIGRIDFLVDADGRILEARLRQIGNRAGRAASASFGKSLQEGMDRQSNTILGRIGRRFETLGSKIRGATSALDDHNRSWRNLPHGFRQAVFWTGLVIASMSELAVLSSALGVGILALGGVIASFGVGLGVTIGALVGFLGDIENLPEALKGPRKAFDALGESFSKLGDELALAAFSGTEKAWESLGKTIEALTPALTEVASVINGFVTDLAKNLEPGQRAFEELNRFVRNSAPIFDRLVRAAGRLGVSLLTAFNNPTMQRAIELLVGYVERLFDQFDQFVQSNDFDDWVNNGIRIFEALGRVLDTTARMLNNLVDQKAVDMLIEFLDDIAGFIEGPGADILEFAKELNIFGLLAEGLHVFGDALEPLGDPMIALADAVSDVISSGIDTLAPIIEGIADALAPFVQALADFIRGNPKAVSDGLIAIAAGFTALIAANKIGQATSLIGGFITKMDDATKKAPTWRAGIGGALAGILSALPGSFDGEVAGGDVVSGLAGGILAGAAVGGPIGAAIGAMSALVTSMLGDLFDENHGVWNDGWDEIFKPGDYSGAGIGQFKQWLDEQFGPWLHDLVQGWSDTLTNWRDVELPAWWTGVIAQWGMFFATLTTSVQAWWETIIQNWTNTFATLKTESGNFWRDVSTGWTTFWGDVGRNVKSGWESASREFGNFFRDVNTNWNNFWNGLVAPVRNAVNGVLGWVNSLLAPIREALGGLGRLSNSTGGGGGGPMRAAASGMLLHGPTRLLAGEAGPEAIVPLDRPLSMVNKDVRWLSAIAQGKMPHMAGGGVVGGGRSVSIDPGAIVIQGSQDPWAVANAMLTRVAEYVNG